MIDPAHPARINEFPRLSERYVCAGIAHEWQLHRPGGLLRKNRVEWVAVEVLDLTVAGARVLGPADDQLTMGAQLPFRFDDHTGRFQIRHVQPAHEDGYALYGVLFVRLSPELERRIFEQVAQLRHSSIALDEHWNNAR